MLLTIRSLRCLHKACDVPAAGAFEAEESGLVQHRSNGDDMLHRIVAAARTGQGFRLTCLQVFHAQLSLRRQLLPVYVCC
jgi:hypothetical protein